ncbi:hypothetical protein RND71_026354 [Anisodus tanguticus]|uniref:Uncharacterized protein n=1 Tax=Anisodus tanguticus TaxID=243964 RepID=A0AAE1VB79_9SOLA|nr:hypothetical protein RND71_026354 [Anisodus tanguticus]
MLIWRTSHQYEPDPFKKEIHVEEERVRHFLYPTVGEMEKDHIRNIINYGDEEVDEEIDALR